MPTRFNLKQKESLSNFFFDVAKGITLGALSFSAISSGVDLLVRLINFISGIILAYLCLSFGLYLIKDRS